MQNRIATNQELMHAWLLVPPLPLVIVVYNWWKEGEEYSILSFKLDDSFLGKWLVLS